MARSVQYMTDMMNPNASTDRNTVLLTLAAQVNEIAQKIASELQSAEPTPRNPRLNEDLHPIEKSILSVLEPGIALKVTDIAKKIGESRSAVHYHRKRLVLKDKISCLVKRSGKHEVFWCFLDDGSVGVPGVKLGKTE